MALRKRTKNRIKARHFGLAKWLKNLKRRPMVLAGIIVATIVVGFLTWLLISALTAEAKLELNTTFTLPSFKSLNNLPELVYKDAAVVIDGTVVKTANTEKTVVPTASTAKMILGLMVMDEKPFSAGEKGETITITQAMYDRYVWYVGHGGSNTKVAVGEEISEYDALMAVFLPSSNNMADALAEWAFGSLENYREQAGVKLKEWGLNDTTIGVDASGFDESTTSTASDLAVIGHKLLQNPVLREIVATKEYEIPVAGTITNTNQILGVNRIIGIKTGYIGEISGYCLVSGYAEGDHLITIALMGAPTRIESFNDSLEIAVDTQNTIQEQTVIEAGQSVGYYDSWWTGPIKIKANEDLKVIGWNGANEAIDLKMDDGNSRLEITIGEYKYELAVTAEEYTPEPSFGERLSHSLGWTKSGELDIDNDTETDSSEEPADGAAVYEAEKLPEETSKKVDNTAKSSTENCTLGFGNLMLINPNFTVSTDYIDARKSQLVSVSSLYGIVEGNPYNGDNLLTPEAAEHLNQMVKAYEAAYPGHTFETRSCYRARGTQCGRLCAATGASDHHTGLTCDLLDPAYGTTLDTDYYNQHIDWQWLYENSYKYGFIDRFPAEWAGGPMSEPLNVDANGTTGLYETWHYRYVGVGPATEIATGKYNGGKYDSLEHYLKARGMVTDLKNGKCN